MAYQVGVVCSLGVGPEKGGRERNEDNYLICEGSIARYLLDGIEQRDPTSGDGMLLAVADGMGGHADGHVASATAARVLAKLYQPGAPRNASDVLLRYIRRAHRSLHHKMRRDGPVTMGTTLTACWIANRRAAWAQVGDSRLYLLRDGVLRQLTPEHTRNEFAKRDGRPTSGEGDALAQSFIFGSRGLGDDASLRLERGLDSGEVELYNGDTLLLCSDGLICAVEDTRIARMLEATADPQEAAEALGELAVERGSSDNVTVLLVRVTGQADAVPEWFDDSEETIRF